MAVSPLRVTAQREDTDYYEARVSVRRKALLAREMYRLDDADLVLLVRWPWAGRNTVYRPISSN